MSYRVVYGETRLAWEKLFLTRSAARVWTVTIESEGPHRWTFTLTAANLDVARYHLALDGGEWRLTSESERFPVAAPWIGQAKIAPFEAVKRALTKLEATHGWG